MSTTSAFIYIKAAKAFKTPQKNAAATLKQTMENSNADWICSKWAKTSRNTVVAH